MEICDQSESIAFQVPDQSQTLGVAPEEVFTNRPSSGPRHYGSPTSQLASPDSSKSHFLSLFPHFSRKPLDIPIRYTLC